MFKLKSLGKWSNFPFVWNLCNIIQFNRLQNNNQKKSMPDFQSTSERKVLEVEEEREKSICKHKIHSN